jgi:hypothetical protein
MAWKGSGDAVTEECARGVNRLRAILLLSLVRTTTLTHEEAEGVVDTVAVEMFVRGARIDPAVMAG